MYTDKELIELLRRKAKKLGRAPTYSEMERDKNFPSVSCYRHHFGSWIKAIKASRLIPLPVKISRDISRRAEIAIRDGLRRIGHKVEDIRGSNPRAPYSLLLNDKIRIHVSGSIWDKRERSGRVNLYWNFSAKRKRRFDYVIGVGMDERRRIKAIFVFPKRKLSVEKSICIPVHSRSKYSRFRVNSLKEVFPKREKR